MNHSDSRTYQSLFDRIIALCDGETDHIAIMATTACELYQSVDGFDWVGFYRVTAPDLLKIGPYQGSHGCLEIPFERGVCGAAARTGKTQLVADVLTFPDHIACSANTRSELVIPCFDRAGQVFSVLDIDSDQPDFFTPEDAAALAVLLARIFWH